MINGRSGQPRWDDVYDACCIAKVQQRYPSARTRLMRYEALVSNDRRSEGILRQDSDSLRPR